MKRLIYLLAITIGLLLPAAFSVGSAAAVDVFQPCSSNAKDTVVCADVGKQTTAKTNPAIGALRMLLDLLAVIAGIAATVMLIISGFRFVTSNGDANGVQAARNSLMYVVVGIIVVVFSQIIVAFVINKL